MRNVFAIKKSRYETINELNDGYDYADMFVKEFDSAPFDYELDEVETESADVPR